MVLAHVRLTSEMCEELCIPSLQDVAREVREDASGAAEVPAIQVGFVHQFLSNLDEGTVM